MQFSPCTGNCTEDGSHCEGCGRSHEEIAATRQLIGAMAEAAAQYPNSDEFIQFIAAKAFGKARLIQMQG